MTKICMNESCKVTAAREWKKGWGLKSGGYATLCYNCGSAYENLLYCETFHLEESGWRECRVCGKRIHCGCIASKYLHEYLDFGGVGCISCAKSLEAHPTRTIQILTDEFSKGFATLTRQDSGGPQLHVAENRMSGISVDSVKPTQLSKITETKECVQFSESQKGDRDASIRTIRQEGNKLPEGEAGMGLIDLIQPSDGSSMLPELENSNSKPREGVKDTYEPLEQPSLNFSLTAPPGAANSVPSFPGGVGERREQNEVHPLLQGKKTRTISPKHLKSSGSTSSVANKGIISQKRLARPPVDDRGRCQLLPRYWPRITEQELKKISGDLNSAVVPLFEKVLSPSDAGRIGRLVLPKACAEAYFPPISQSDGMPIRIQDIKGKEWTFQFRFWPNNNSRMYVLEGVTPCIQNMQLEAGDTVTFSRRDPGGQLVMGSRKASNLIDMQDGQTSALPNEAFSVESSISGFDEHLSVHGGRINKETSQRPLLHPEKKKARNIGSKNRRLLMDSEDSMQLRVTWTEAQELLRPPPNTKPTVVMVEDHEFEEYDVPPVLGKRTIFTTQPSGLQEQWAQCDSCSKWRKLPYHILLPPKWTCSENIWDSSRCSCSAPDEMIPEELERFLGVGKGPKKRKIIKSHDVAQDHEPSGLDALATAAVLGDILDDSGESSVGATTKHPRHRPGCTCIVCIQPPSGTGRHDPSCTCNVCLTVKRRFNTLMMRKKKRQSEREAEIAQGKKVQPPSEDESRLDGASGHALPYVQMHSSEDERSQPSRVQMDVAETSMGHLDLNCHPNREEELLAVPMNSLIHGAGIPLEM